MSSSQNSSALEHSLPSSAHSIIFSEVSVNSSRFEDAKQFRHNRDHQVLLKM